MWGPWMVLAQAAPDGDKWVSLLFGSGGLLAGLMIAVRAYDSGRVVTRAQHEATIKELKCVHAAHVAALEARALEDREQRARWETLAFEAWRVRHGREREREPLSLDGNPLERIG